MHACTHASVHPCMHAHSCKTQQTHIPTWIHENTSSHVQTQSRHLGACCVYIYIELCIEGQFNCTRCRDTCASTIEASRCCHALLARFHLPRGRGPCASTIEVSRCLHVASRNLSIAPLVVFEPVGFLPCTESRRRLHYCCAGTARCIRYAFDSEVRPSISLAESIVGGALQRARTSGLLERL